MSQMSNKDRWVTRFGLVMAMAGNAVGLGNFLRFPGKAAPFGGAFMIPYFLALLLMGIPLMWVEWTIGRHGGRYGHGSTPGMFHRLWKHPISKYLGIFGVLLPFLVGLYYTYIESWALGYAWQTFTGAYWGQESRAEMSQFFGGYLGTDGCRLPFLPESMTLAFTPKAYLFFLITCAINFLVFYRGISKGIEIVAKYAMPTLLVLGIILAVRVLTLPAVEGRTVSIGLARIWVIDWSVLKNVNVWIEASGQIFFTLSVGLGMVHCYASYLRKNDDITLNGLTTCGLNEFVEVILGGTIVIPAAAVFFGSLEFSEIVQKGSFADLGFQTFPVVFQQMPGGRIFGSMWFVLLFLAGLTSSCAMFTPMLQFIEDELNVQREKAARWMGVVVFLLMQPVVLFFHRDVLDELDYWGGTLLLCLFACIEIVIFAWIFGLERGWKEMHEGADFQVPRIFYYILKYVTPVYAIFLMVWWTKDGLMPKLLMDGVPDEKKPYLWLARAIILGVTAFLVWGIWYAWRTHPKFFEDSETEEDTP